MLHKGLLCLALFAACTASHAKDKDCSASKNSNCIAESLRAKTAELTSTYNALHTATKAKTELEDSQSSWSTYRDKQCGEYIAKAGDSSAATLQSQACKLTITTERLQLLKSLSNKAA